jgi:gamma-glutamyltranspeptidase / glutathione hydrolase
MHRTLLLIRAFASCVLITSACATPPPVAAPQPVAAAPIERRLPAASSEPGVAVGTHAAVASAEPNASRVALAVLQSGGNAVDAAISLAFALAVTHPTAGNLGGGGFLVLRTADGQSTTIDYRETAPAAASRDMYLDSHGQVTQDALLGARAAGIPGTVAGMWLAHQRYGSKPWAELIAPAIALAREGHALDAAHAASLARAVDQMHKAGFDSSARYFEVDGKPVAEGQHWQQPELAQTLSEIAESAQSFYTGALAKRLVTQMQAAGGIWSERDLADYRAEWREPLTFVYRGHELITMPPPSAGGIVMRQMLFASEQLHMEQAPYRSPLAFHLYLEAARRAYADRNTWVADPAFFSVPTQALMDPTYISARMRDIDPEHATPSSQVAAGAPLSAAARESHETTHFSVVDAAGAAVSNTYTLNASFGAKRVLEGSGILLNNEMDDFASNPGKPNAYGLVQGEQNKIEPKKRMLSSMTPTIVVKAGQLRAVLGTPGGPTITTTVVQLVRALIDYQVTLDVAVRAPRIHHQWLPDGVIAEPDAEPEILEGLRTRGHSILPNPFGKIGHADCIEVDPASLGFRAVADVTRGSGGALAY